MIFNSNILARDMDYWRELKRLGIRHFSVSVDSLTQAVAGRCRAGTQVDKLRERLTQLVLEGFVILVSIVLSRLNLDDLPQTLRELDRIARLGTMAVEIQPLIPYDGGDPTIVLDEEAMAKYHQTASQIRPSLRYLAEFQEAAALTRRGACNRPFTSPYVTVDGYLTPCCSTNDASLFGFLRADLLPFERLWNHPTVHAWRAAYRRQPPAICAGCAFNPVAVAA